MGLPFFISSRKPFSLIVHKRGQSSQQAFSETRTVLDWVTKGLFV